ncbi:hypothetical protein [Gimesia sp.]|uniref:hypothetical protein n=1 Tax=Gimesia sp. TaxID=2024833 RepID=UPI003A953A58
MSASWKAVGKGEYLKSIIELSWSDRASPPFECRIVKADEVLILHFLKQLEVDDWASAEGVSKWSITQMTRCYPQASNLQMIFPDAPGETILKQALDELRSGKDLREIANTLSVSPLELGTWLRGYAPREKCIPQFNN